MLNRLTISNFALIDNLNLQFNSGYAVITGETGAGKSIILKALNLLLGDRADYSVIKVKEDKCIIEAEFNVSALALEQTFKDWDLDYEPQTIIRREFLPSGKSRLFINDTPTTLNALKELGKHVIKIHTQHETLDLFDKQFQLNTLDAFAGNNDQAQEYGLAYADWQANIKDLKALSETVAERKKAQDYTQFLIDEFEKANFKNLNIDELLAEAEELNNWDQIQGQLTASLSALTDEQFGPSQMIKTGVDALSKISHLSPKYQNLLERFQSVRIEVDDIEAELTDMVNGADIDDERKSIVETQVEAINSLLYKHNCTTGEELKAILSDLESEVHSFSDLEAAIVTLEESINKATKTLEKMALALREKRLSRAPKFEKAVQKILAELGMPNAEIKADVTPSESFNKNGLDTVQYLFKTNLGGEFLPVSKTASGGELSRLMLSILHITSEIQKLPTLIFDEIDTGVSGEIASKMATLFAKMGEHTQLISISHLPQIASKASTHYHVYKTVANNTTTTQVKALSSAERINELAKMMSGENVSEKAIENAKLLLETK